jgi:hypothetical protein
MSTGGRRVAVLALVCLASCAGDGTPPNVPPIQLASPEPPVARELFEQPLGAWLLAVGTWVQRPGPTGSCLAQTATDQAFPVALWPAQRWADVEASVRFRPISGRVDASGGLVFRARDARNYYIVRANSLEDNFRLYTVKDGNREQIAGTTIVPPALGAWHSLRVVALGARIQAWLDGTLLIDHEDRSFDVGHVGLWTKADAVTEFDDLEVKGRPAPTR